MLPQLIGSGEAYSALVKFALTSFANSNTYYFF